MDRGPAGNISLAAAIPLAKELNRDQILVVQETEYTGAGKLASAQLTFARENGVKVRLGDPRDNVPGKAIIIPESAEQMHIEEINLDDIRKSHMKFVLGKAVDYQPTKQDVLYFAEELKTSTEKIHEILSSLDIQIDT